MTGEETFEFAAAVAGVTIGLAALILIAVVAIVGVWQLFRRASEASAAATRAALGAEDLARHVAAQLAAQPATGNGAQLAELRQQAAELLEQQRELQDVARQVLDTGIEGGGVPPGEIERSINRLDVTVGEMAASLANLVQQLERQQERER